MNNSKRKSWLIPNKDGRSDNMHRQRRVVNRATKYVQKKGMGKEEALKASKKRGRRNAMLLVSASSAILATTYLAAKKQSVEYDRQAISELIDRFGSEKVNEMTRS